VLSIICGALVVFLLLIPAPERRISDRLLERRFQWLALNNGTEPNPNQAANSSVPETPATAMQQAGETGSTLHSSNAKRRHRPRLPLRPAVLRSLFVRPYPTGHSKRASSDKGKKAAGTGGGKAWKKSQDLKVQLKGKGKKEHEHRHSASRHGAKKAASP
jgi:hypothetical protein